MFVKSLDSDQRALAEGFFVELGFEALNSAESCRRDDIELIKAIDWYLQMRLASILTITVLCFREIPLK